MHELVHAIEELTDNNFACGFTFRQDSAGDTQHFTNDIHAELGVPLRIYYNGRRKITDPGGVTSSQINFVDSNNGVV